VTHLPEVEGARHGMVECRVVLDLYHFFEGANEIHCCNLDCGDTARIVTENPAIELDDRFAFQPD